MSLSSICYSFVGTDGFIFTRLTYTGFKNCIIVRSKISMLTEMTYFEFLFHFLMCHFLWSTHVVQWFTFLGGFNSSVAVPSCS